MVSFFNIFHNRYLPLFEHRDYIYIFFCIRNNYFEFIKKFLPQVLPIISSVRIQIIVSSFNIFTQVDFKNDTRNANLLLSRNILHLVHLEFNVLEIFFQILFPILPIVEERYLEHKHFHKSREGNLK